MTVVTIRKRPPALHRPVLVAAFQGWNDAGEAASGALDALAASIGAETFAEIDPEEFFDFQATRPLLRRTEEDGRRIDWPGNAFSWAMLPGTGRHAVILQGTEPNLRWRTFTAGVTHLAKDLDVELVVTLGALQVDVPHTRPVPVTGSTTDLVLSAALGLRASRYEGPTGITGVLHQASTDAGLRAVSLWAGVPHYLAGMRYLPGAQALAERVVRLLEMDVPLDELAGKAATQRDELSELVAADDELRAYVDDLEERVDEQPDAPLDLPPGAEVSGDELAADIERYLRDRDDG